MTDLDWDISKGPGLEYQGESLDNSQERSLNSFKEFSDNSSLQESDGYETDNQEYSRPRVDAVLKAAHEDVNDVVERDIPEPVVEEGIPHDVMMRRFEKTSSIPSGMVDPDTLTIYLEPEMGIGSEFESYEEKALHEYSHVIGLYYRELIGDHVEASATTDTGSNVHTLKRYLASERFAERAKNVISDESTAKTYPIRESHIQQADYEDPRASESRWTSIRVEESIEELMTRLEKEVSG